MIAIPIVEDSLDKVLSSLTTIPKDVDVIEIRLDYIKNIRLDDLDKIRKIQLKKKIRPIIITLRKKGLGNRYDYDEEKRLFLLKKAVTLGFDYIDIELNTAKDQIIRIINNRTFSRSKTKIIISYHDFKKTPSLISLKRIHKKILSLKPDMAKIVTKAKTIEDNNKIFDLLTYSKKTTKKPLISFCMGIQGKISRILTKKFSSYLTFASLMSGKESAPGQISLDEMINIYNIKKINTKTKIYGLVGNPVDKSKGYIFHNHFFNRYKIDAVYVPFQVLNLKRFLMTYDYLLDGISITMPYKSSILDLIDNLPEDIGKLGAINTIAKKRGNLIATNTDTIGAIKALKKKTTLKGKVVTVLGSGGASRAIIAGLKKEGCNIIIINRTLSKAEKLASQFGCIFSDLHSLKILYFDILINATSVGMKPNINKTLIPKSLLKRQHVVMDIIYNPEYTRLLKDARSKKADIISGLDMFTFQAIEQFKLWTGKTPDFHKAKNIILESF